MKSDRKVPMLDYQAAKASGSLNNPASAFNTGFLVSIVSQILVVNPIFHWLMFRRTISADAILYLLFVYSVWFGLCSLLRVSCREVLGVRWGGRIGLAISLCPLIYIYGARPA